MLGKHEYMTTHYRRFIEPKVLKKKLSKFLKIIYFKESKNLAKFKNENPCVIRIILKKIDQNFVEVINILNKNKIHYWLCHGTLLGIVRDGELIPWDHDIDIALWYDNSLKKNFIKLMKNHQFILKTKYLIDDDLLTFTKEGGRQVDINFYEKEL